jgi:hypothetical protein
MYSKIDKKRKNKIAQQKSMAITYVICLPLTSLLLLEIGSLLPIYEIFERVAVQ